MNARDIEESEAAWKAQFDPSSDTYHHGDTREIKPYAAAVPASMPSEFAEQQEVSLFVIY